jgi:acetyl esterase/lipase
VAVLLLSGVAVSRLIADLLVSVARVQADPWLATGIGLAAGAALAALAWRAARQELTGEVAGSVLFLPAFDRTKAELITSLKEAAAGEGVGRPRERSGRRRTVLVWARAKTRATVLRSSYDTRAIVLRTIGSPNFAVHARLKGAILDRLDPGRRK